MNFDDLNCTLCGGELRGGGPITVDFVEKYLTCFDCGQYYPALWGVPYLAGFERTDILGLIEIAANIDNMARNESHTRNDLDRWRKLIMECHACEDRQAFFKAAPNWANPWLPPRYTQWYQYNLLTEHMDLKGANALDVGAGLGFDTSDVVADGARVTALEFSPLLARAGSRVLPEVRWIGGVSHALPFAANSFDYIFCNASLHHMHDVPNAIYEMLRVLRCGGILITTGDSYCSDRAPANLELDIFNRNQAVLGGVNERILRFGELAETLDAYSDILDIDVAVYAKNTPYESLADSFGFLILDYKKNRREIASNFQTISLRIKLKDEFPAKKQLQNSRKMILEPFKYAALLDNQAKAIASLTSLLPSEFVDMPYPGITGSKFSLLNGWQNPIPFSDWRQAYKRARLFYCREKFPDILRLFIRPVIEKGDNPRVKILVNGRRILSKGIPGKGWSALDVPLGSVLPDERFALEIQMDREGEAFDDGLFRISFKGGWRLDMSDRFATLGMAISRFRGKLIRIKTALPRIKANFIKMVTIHQKFIKILNHKRILPIIKRVITYLVAVISRRYSNTEESYEQDNQFMRALLANSQFRTHLLQLAARNYTTEFQQHLVDEEFCSICYSHEGEDLLLQRLVGARFSGFYVDIGAHDPRKFSNTCMLYKQGWRGINIDATPGSMDTFRRLRPEDTNIECSITDKTEIMTFYIFKEGALNTSDKTLARKYIKSGWELETEIEITPRSLKSVLGEHLPIGQEIDILNIDVEGEEYGVLASNDWTRYRPKLILVEVLDAHLDVILEMPVVQFLESKGYKVISKLATTIVFEKVEQTACAGS